MTNTEGVIALGLVALMALLALAAILVGIVEPDPPSRLMNGLFGSALACGVLFLIVTAPGVFLR